MVTIQNLIHNVLTVNSESEISSVSVSVSVEKDADESANKYFFADVQYVSSFDPKLFMAITAKRSNKKKQESQLVEENDSYVGTVDTSSNKEE